MIFFSNKSRPYHFGPYPLERIARDPSIRDEETGRPRARRPDANPAQDSEFAEAVEKYHQIFHSLRNEDVAPGKAPVPDDLVRRAVDVKGAAYFLNANMVGITELTDTCWLDGSTSLGHSHAFVILIEHGRMPEEGSLAKRWVESSIETTAEFRAYEIAISIASHIQKMGFSAIAHLSLIHI